METDLMQKLSQGTDVLDGVHVEMTNVRGFRETPTGDIYAVLSLPGKGTRTLKLLYKKSLVEKRVVYGIRQLN